MIVFSGWATLVGFVGAAVLGGALVSVTDSRAASYAVAGAALAAFGWWINMVDVDRHRLFWIPIEYWGVAIAIGAIAGL